MTKLTQTKDFAAFYRLLSAAIALTAWLFAGAAGAAINGVTGTSFSLSAREGYISIADGGSIYSWGYTMGSTMQLPGPTMLVEQGATITVVLTNDLPAAAGNVSIVFPGHEVAVSGGVPGELTQEAVPGGAVTYSFTAGLPGTYQYHSGTQTDLQVEMGLYGALIVYPSGQPVAPATSGCAYGHAGSCFDREFLFLLSEIDIDVHQAAESQAGGAWPIVVPTGAFAPSSSEYWLLNGRAAPDTMAAAGTSLLPTQPYNSFPHMYPGERLLLRIVGAGREQHPFHTHGNHSRLLARDGRLITNDSGATLAGPLLFTIASVPGGTADSIFEWTGKDLGWDIYGHVPGDGSSCTEDANGYDVTTSEWCADHNKAFPVTLPSLSSLAFGGFYSGSPFLGGMGSLPPGEGGLNPNAGFAYMWHSHTERELVNNDVFPGGMMTMLIIESHSAPITD